MDGEADTVGSYVTTTPGSLSVFERLVIEAIMSARHGLDDAAEREMLSDYLDLALVTKREHTVVGSYTHFLVPEGAAPLRFTHETEMSDVGVEYDGIQYSIGTVLWGRSSGHITCLEMFVFEGELPPFIALVPSRIKEIYSIKKASGVSASIRVDPLTGATLPRPPEQ